MDLIVQPSHLLMKLYLLLIEFAGKNMNYGYIKICISSFYMYLFFQIDIFTLNSRKKSKQNTHLNGRKLVEDANMTLV